MAGLLLITSCNKADIQREESKITLRDDCVDDCEVIPVYYSSGFITGMGDPCVQRRMNSSNDPDAPRIYLERRQTNPKLFVFPLDSLPKLYWQSDGECELTLGY